jgi:hypothetical protein
MFSHYFEMENNMENRGHNQMVLTIVPRIQYAYHSLHQNQVHSKRLNAISTSHYILYTTPVLLSVEYNIICTFLMQQLLVHTQIIHSNHKI